MRSQDRERIRSLTLFREMAPERFAALMAAALLQRFPAHVDLFHAGERPQFLHVLLDGLLEYYVQKGDQRVTLQIVKPVLACILPALVTDRSYLGSARTLTKAEVLLVPAETFRTQLKQDGALAHAVVLALANGYRAGAKNLESLKLRRGTERLAAFLLGADAEGGRTGRIDLPFEKRTLASLLGMSAANLSRALSTLGKRAIEVRGRVIKIRDRAALIETAHPDPLIDDPLI